MIITRERRCGKSQVHEKTTSETVRQELASRYICSIDRPIGGSIADPTWTETGTSRLPNAPHFIRDRSSRADASLDNRYGEAGHAMKEAKRAMHRS